MLEEEIQHRTMRRVATRLLPILMLGYLVCFLDRGNISFAALTMSADLGFTATIYGFGAGIFFLGYFLCEVPSNLILTRVGARIWFARIMITWGLISAATAFAIGPDSFYLIRFLLGASEAGFFPGIIFYLSCWLPSIYRARVIGAFIVAVPLSAIVGGPISGLFLDTMGGVLGLKAWQWLFILEGLPSVLLGLYVLGRLTDRPADARWLAAEQREWLVQRLRSEAAATPSQQASVWRTLVDPRVIAMALIYFGNSASLNGVGLWLPQIVKRFGSLTNTEIGLIGAVPYIAAAVGMVVLTRMSDRLNERKWHVVGTLLLGAFGLLVSALTTSPLVAVIGLSLAATGILSAFAIFWPIPIGMFRGTPSAAAIGLIGGIGNLGGFAGSYLVGWLRDMTGSFAAGLGGLAACGVSAAVIMMFLPLGHLRRSGVAAIGDQIG